MVMIARVMRTYLLGLLMLVCVASFASHVRAGGENAVNNQRTPAQLYRRYCVSCHGSDGKAKTSKGKYGHARDFTDAQWQTDVSDERIFNSIMNGRNERGNMPAFSNKLKENEVNSLVSFVRAFKG
jgi:mono/diheme cytochrome c family protein